MTAKEFIESKEWTQDTVHFSINDVVDLMQEYARIKCLEAIKNTKEKTLDIAGVYLKDISYDLFEEKIQNIPNQDVMPEL